MFLQFRIYELRGSRHLQFRIYELRGSRQTVVLELTKLFPEDRDYLRNNHFNLSAYIIKLQNDRDFSIKIPKDIFLQWNQEIEALYQDNPLTGVNIIGRLIKQRHRKIAHTDKGRFSYNDGTDALTLENVDEAIRVAARITDEINIAVLGTQILFDVPLGSPSQELIKIVTRLADDRRLIYKG